MRTAVAGRVVAVTGGARGIGRAIAERLAADGAYVAIGDRNAHDARTTAAELPGTVAAFDCDVTDTTSFENFLRSAADQWGPVDVLVNNAGVMWVGNYADEPETATEQQLAVNLHGVIRGVKLAAPTMRDRGHGHIVTVASIAATLSPAGESTYAATKHGVLGYLSGVRAELRHSGVTLSVVMPSVVDTELAAGTSSGAARRLTPGDVADTVAGTIHRPRFEVSVPAYLGPLSRLVHLFPQRTRDLLLRTLVPDQIRAVTGTTTRARYHDRNLTDTKTDKQGSAP